MKKISLFLLITIFICFNASIFGMKRNAMAINIQENQTQADQKIPVIESIWPEEVITLFAAHSQPEEKNELMRTCTKFMACLTQGKDIIIAMNPWTTTWKECEKTLFRTVRVDNAYPEGAGKNAYYLAQRLLDTQLVNINDMKNILGKTPFHYAQEKDNKTMEDLLKKNVNPSDFTVDPDDSNSFDDYINLPNPNITPLQEAVYQGNKEEVERLFALEGTDPNLALPDGTTLLGIAAHEGHTEIVKLLLAKDGININQANIEEKRTPLILATLNKNYLSIQLLITAGADVNQAEIYGNTPLIIACRKDYIEIVKLLLAINTIDINQADNYGTTPLCGASMYGHTEIVKVLVATDGINIDQVDNYESTPFYWAAEIGHINIVKLLLATRGVNINQKNRSNCTPLLKILHNGPFEVANLLIAAGAKPKYPVEILNTLLKQLQTKLPHNQNINISTEQKDS